MDILPKGESAQMVGNKVKATLSWRAAVDLDLHVMYALKNGRTVVKEAKSGLLGKLTGGLIGGGKPVEVREEGHISFRNRGSKTRSPFIELDHDAGIGDRGGDNEENVHFVNLDNVERAIIVANIFAKPMSNFAKFDGHVIVECGSDKISCPLSSSSLGSWCTVAMLDNTGITPRLININETTMAEPSISDFL